MVKHNTNNWDRLASDIEHAANESMQRLKKTFRTRRSRSGRGLANGL